MSDVAELLHTPLDLSFVEAQVGTVSNFFVIDNGEGADAVDIISGLRVNAPAGADQEFCNNQPLAIVTAPIERGNATVRSF